MFARISDVRLLDSAMQIASQERWAFPLVLLVAAYIARDTFLRWGHRAPTGCRPANRGQSQSGDHLQNLYSPHRLLSNVKNWFKAKNDSGRYLWLRAPWRCL